MSSRRREQILENCRWLFDQEVQIITFVVRKYFRGTPNLDNSVNRGPYELHYYAAVLPKECSLRSLAETDIEEKILFKEFHLLSSDGAISALLDTVEKKIGTVLEEDPENGGRIRISPFELPIKSGEEQVKKLPARRTTGEPPSLLVPDGGKVPPSGTVPSGLQPPDKIASPDEIPLVSPAETVAPEETVKLFFEGLLNKKNGKSARVTSQGTAEGVSGWGPKDSVDTKTGGNISDGLSQLTERNLSLLEKENKRTKGKKAKVTGLTSMGLPKKQCLQQQNLISAPEAGGTFQEYLEAPSKDHTEGPPKSEYTNTPLGLGLINLAPLPEVPPDGFELEQRIIELEEKLRMLDTLVKSMQPKPYEFGELSTPAFHYVFSPLVAPAPPPLHRMSNPIMTPTTSVASDTNFSFRQVSMQ